MKSRPALDAADRTKSRPNGWPRSWLLPAFQPDVKFPRLEPRFYVNDSGAAADRTIFRVDLVLAAARVNEDFLTFPAEGTGKLFAPFGRSGSLLHPFREFRRQSLKRHEAGCAALRWWYSSVMIGRSRSKVSFQLFARFLLLAALAFSVTGCGYNEVVDRDEDVKASWAEVQNQYKRRSDLVPNLVKVVKGAGQFEQETLEKVVQARSQVAGMKVDSSLIDDPAKLKQFEAAQQQLSGALSRLLVVAERYPELKATDSYRDLQSQLEGTENRIAVARKRYIENVSEYNKTVQRFPTSIGALLRGKSTRPTFEGAPGAENPPEVDL